MTPATVTATRLSWWVPAVAIVAVAWLAFWLAQSFPIPCNLVGPCQFRSVRMAPALLFGGMMVAPLAVVVLVSLLPLPVRWLITAAYVLLVALAVSGYAAITVAFGFAVDGPFLMGLLAVCATAFVARSGIAAVRRDLAEG